VEGIVIESGKSLIIASGRWWLEADWSCEMLFAVNAQEREEDAGQEDDGASNREKL